LIVRNRKFKGETQKPIDTGLNENHGQSVMLLPSALEWLVLLPETQTLDYGSVAFHIIFFDIIQQSSSLADQFQQAAPGVMIFLVRLEMLGQIFDPRAQQGNLYFGRTGILLVKPVVFN
jgi:hypothetical protein